MRNGKQSKRPTEQGKEIGGDSVATWLEGWTCNSNPPPTPFDLNYLFQEFVRIIATIIIAGIIATNTAEGK